MRPRRAACCELAAAAAAAAAPAARLAAAAAAPMEAAGKAVAKKMGLLHELSTDIIVLRHAAAGPAFRPQFFDAVGDLLGAVVGAAGDGGASEFMQTTAVVALGACGMLLARSQEASACGLSAPRLLSAVVQLLLQDDPYLMAGCGHLAVSVLYSWLIGAGAKAFAGLLYTDLRSRGRASRAGGGRRAVPLCARVAFGAWRRRLPLRANHHLQHVRAVAEDDGHL